MIIFDEPPLDNFSFDYIVSTCIGERRASYICRKGVAAPIRLAIQFSQRLDEAVTSVREDFVGAGWSIVDAVVAKDSLMKAIALKPNGRFAIDISSMPRAIIAEFVELLTELAREIEVTFLYCPASYETSVNFASQDQPLSANPVSPFFSGELRSPSIPVGLVIGVGLERFRSLGIIELIEPSRTWAFYGGGRDSRFLEDLLEVRSSLAGVIEEASVFEYNVHSLQSIFYSIESLCFGAALRYRLVLAPSGPKIFTLACLLVGAPRQELRPAVWRVGSSSGVISAEVEESGEIVASRVVFHAS